MFFKPPPIKAATVTLPTQRENNECKDIYTYSYSNISNNKPIIDFGYELSLQESPYKIWNL